MTGLARAPSGASQSHPRRKHHGRSRNPRTAEALERLARGAALVTSRAWQAYLDTARRFHNYSFTNILLIRAQVPEATRVAGFQAWKALGRTVRRGEHAIWILAPLTRRLAAEEEDDPAEKVRVIMGFRAVSVFDVSQTDGEPLAELPCHRLSGDDPTGSYDRLRRFAHGLGYTVEEDYLPGEMNGDCNFALRRLRIEVHNDELQQAKSLAHELGHVLLHDGFPGSRELAELEAESVAYLVCDGLGVDSSSYSFGYVANWAGGGDGALAGIKASGRRVQSAARQILDGLATIQAAQAA